MNDMLSADPNLPLTEEHLLLAKFFEHSPDLLCVASFEGKFIKINPSVCKVLGYTHEELMSLRITDLVFEGDKVATAQTRRQMLRGEPLVNFENRYVKKSGEIVWLSWTSIPVYENRCVFAVAKDVTVRKEMERQREKLFNNISEANKNLEHFARIASHNLRSPISNISCLFDLIDLEKIGSDDNLKIINLIKLSTEKVSTTLENYIDELVSNKNNSDLRLERLSISSCFKDVCDSVSSLIEQNSAVIETDFSAFDHLDYNKGYLESILLNLLTNALKYCKPNQAPHVVFKTQLVNHAKQLVVTDQGIGFDMERAKGHIFGLNKTFHTNRDAKGVGLFLVKKHINELGGSITVDSHKNVGTTFVITFSEE